MESLFKVKIMDKKVCSKCKEEKEVCEFSKDSNTKDNLTYKCKLCRKKYYNENKTNLLKSLKLYREVNKGTINKKSLNNYYNNKEHKIKVMVEYNRNRRKNDEIFNIIHSIRIRLNKYLKINNIQKNNTTIKIIGCTPEFLKEHILNQFVNGMNWENRNEWHIDHIIPLSSAKTKDEIIKLSHYTNLQPLWAEDNLKKSNKIL
jgi:hypothetical protein